MYNLAINEELISGVNTEMSMLKVEVEDLALNKKAMFSVVHSNHSLDRSNQRHITKKLIVDALVYGDCITKQGYDFYILTKKICEDYGLIDSLKEKSLVIVVSGEKLITCYYSKNGPKHIKRKSKTLY